MLFAIGSQLFEGAVKFSVGDETIELSKGYELEEETECMDEVPLISFAKNEGFVNCSKRVFCSFRAGFEILKQHKKIPVPPPELV